MTTTDLLFNGPDETPFTLALAHGAGAPMDSTFMTFMAERLADRGVRVARFEFPYMSARRRGERRPPDREAVLRATWLSVIETLGGGPRVIVGGKSMGGRIASLVADGANVRGLICLGYPFHPPGKPTHLRTAHLAALRTRTLIVQGTRDPFGTEAEIAGTTLSPSITVRFLPDGEHSFKPRVKSGRTEAQNLTEAVELVAGFVRGGTTGEPFSTTA